MNILEEAAKANAERAAIYGSPFKHFSRTIGMINAAYTEIVRERLARGEPMFNVLDWPKMMTMDKLARGTGEGFHRDSVVDRAGYANAEALLHEEQARRNSPEGEKGRTPVGLR